MSESETKVTPGSIVPRYATLQDGLAAAEREQAQNGRAAALTVLADLCDQFAGDPEPFFRHARLLKEDGRGDEADRVLQQAQQRFKDHFGFWLQRAWLAHESRDFAAAGERWAEMREIFPDHPAGYSGGAVSLRDGGRLDEAEALIADGAERFPQDAGLAMEYGRAALARGDFTAAAGRWAEVLEQFPDQAGSYLGLATALRELGRLDEAEDHLREAMRRFPDDAGPVIDFAWIAQIRHDWAEAVQRWDEVRRRLPDRPGPYLRGAGGLRFLRRFDEADALLAEAVKRLPGEPQALLDYARLAQERNDLPEAVRRWEQVRGAFPDNPEGYSGGAAALSALRRDQEAEELLAAALARFPASAETLRDYAELAARREAFDLALQRYAQLRERFPDEPAGYFGAVTVLGQQGRIVEADAVLEAGMQRLPDNPHLALAHAHLAMHLFAERPDRDKALARLASIRERFPEFEPAYAIAIRVLREAGRHDDAEALALETQNRFPSSLEPAVEHARIALQREDWHEAIRRFTQITESFPNEAAGYVGLAQALSRAGQLDDADAVLRYAMARFPGDTAPFAEYGLVAIRRNDWKSALERALTAQQRFPNDAGLNHRVFEARLRLAESDPAAIVDEPGDAPEAGVDDPHALMMRFESLGGSGHGCEFGIVQRKFGAEPLGLLRWADLGADAEGLIAALDTDFGGIGEPEHTELITLPTGGREEYWTRDRRYWMAMRAFIFEDEIPRDKMYAQACRRLQYLRRKLTDDLRESSKIFVYKNMFRDLTDIELTRLHAAVRRYGDNTLLYVRLADAQHPGGTVDAAAPGLLVGYIDHFAFSPKNEPQGEMTLSWLALCREAVRITTTGRSSASSDIAVALD